jgi:lipopolysaccharide transport system ATP-binding protein
MLQDGTPHDVVKTYLSSGLGTTAERVWTVSTAPGGEVARLRSVRVRSEDGNVTEALDIRRPVEVDMEYEVLRDGYVLLPWYQFYNEEGICAFEAVDLDPAWRGRRRPIGHYVSSAWIPGNLLAEGTLFVTAGLHTLDPMIRQFQERDVVAFQVVDTQDGDSARGDTTGPWNAVMRPLLNWNTQFSPNNGTG